MILKDCLSRGAELIKNADPDKYAYTGYGFGFDSRSGFSFTDLMWFWHLVWCELISVYCNKRKDILFLGFGPTQRLDNTNWTAEAQYSINFSKSNRKFCLSLHYNGTSRFFIC